MPCVWPFAPRNFETHRVIVNPEDDAKAEAWAGIMRITRRRIGSKRVITYFKAGASDSCVQILV